MGEEHSAFLNIKLTHNGPPESIKPTNAIYFGFFKCKKLYLSLPVIVSGPYRGQVICQFFNQTLGAKCPWIQLPE